MVHLILYFVLYLLLVVKNNTASWGEVDKNKDGVCPIGSFRFYNDKCYPCLSNTYNDLEDQSKCKYCPTGTISDFGSISVDQCTDCPKGNYVTKGDCIKCPVNTYNSKTSQTECFPCPQGAASLDGSESIDNCTVCQNGEYVSRSGRCETECPAGSYVEYGNQCLAYCPPDTYSSLPNQIECLPCPSGSLAPENSTSATACIACPKGNYAFKGECVKCPKNTYASSKGQTECTSCPVGSTSFKGSASESDCKECPKGKYVLEGDCISCPTNTYTSLSGRTKCIACTTGSTSSVGSEYCTVCPAGRYVQNGKCTECPKNHYNSLPMQTNCTYCPEGTTSTEGATSADDCVCPENTYKSDKVKAGQIACRPCPKGLTSLKGTTSAEMCIVCPSGSYVNQDTGKCVLCPKNRYSNLQGQTKCKSKCPSGHTSPEGSTMLDNCTVCPMGNYVDSFYADCVACFHGEYNDKAGQTACKSCPEGAMSPGGAVSIDDCVCREGYHKSGTTCSKCPLNTFNPEQGQENCIPCPLSGQTTLSEGSTAEADCSCPEATYLYNETSSRDHMTQICRACSGSKSSPRGSTTVDACTAKETGLGTTNTALIAVCVTTILVTVTVLLCFIWRAKKKKAKIAACQRAVENVRKASDRSDGSDMSDDESEEEDTQIFGLLQITDK